MQVGIETVVSYFPDTVRKAHEYAYLAPVMPDGMTGPDEKRELRDPLAAEIMAREVAAKALDRAGLEARDIDLLVTQNIGGRYIMPGLATFLHHELGFREETPAWNLQTSCASFLDGCQLGWNMVRSGECRRILIATVTALSTGGWGVDQTTPFASAAGDGAGAAIVSGENLKCEFLSYSNRTLGEIYAYMTVDFEPAAHPELLRHRNVGNVSAGLHVADEFFDWVTTKAGKSFARDSIGTALAKAGLSFSDLDLVIPHQAHAFMLELWQEGLEEVGVPAEKWRDTWHQHGNIGAVDVAAILSGLWENDEIRKGSVIAFFAPGAGGHTPTMIVRWLAD